VKRVGVLPTLVTVANGYCGLLAIYKIHDDRYATAALLILLAMVFDLLDGKVARMAGVTSKFGAYLDSLSDAISFGIAPAFLVKAVVETELPGLAGGSMPKLYGPKMLTLATSVFAICALMRLARYNVEHDASGEGSDNKGEGISTFDGIPTPGAAGIVASLVFLAQDENPLFDYSFLYYVLPAICAALGYLMISRIQYAHFGSRFLQGRGDFRYLFVVFVVIALVTRFPQEMLAFGFLVYGLTGPIMAPFRRRKARQEQDEESVKIPDGM
jgi:CDP-diacylglycerol--serine O-phosphatidyltransferase